MNLFFKHYSVSGILSFVMSVAMLISCSSNNKSPEVDVSNHYRDFVHAKFQDRVERHNADGRYLLIVDYSIPSNDYRLFIWDTEQDCIVEKFWCAHGRGGGSTPKTPVFSNTPGSKCSSLGWYLVDKSVGVSYHWGYKYHAVDGLDTSNSNARSRQILIHPWSSVTRDYKARISRPMSTDGRCEGCFTTTDEGFATIDKYVKSCHKLMLLVAINGIQ